MPEHNQKDEQRAGVIQQRQSFFRGGSWSDTPVKIIFDIVAHGQSESDRYLTIILQENAREIP